MKIESFIHKFDGQHAVSIELPGGTGFDAYDDGSIIPWDGNGSFTVCEATRNLHCFAPIGEVLLALTRAEAQLHVELDYACVIPGSA